MASLLLVTIWRDMLDPLPIYSEQLASQNFGISSVHGKHDLGLDVTQRTDHPLVELAQRLVSQRQVQAKLATLE